MMAEEEFMFESLSDIVEFLKAKRKERFPQLIDEQKHVFPRTRYPLRTAYYHSLCLFERGLMPKRGSSKVGYLDTHLSALGFSDTQRRTLIKKILLFTCGEDEDEVRQEADKEIEISYSEDNGKTAEELIGKLGLTREDLTKNKDWVAELNMGGHSLSLDEVYYFVSLLVQNYNYFNSQINVVLERSRRLGIKRGIIGSSLLGVYRLEDLLLDARDLPDVADTMKPTLLSVQDGLGHFMSRGYSGARIVKESLDAAQKKYLRKRKRALDELRRML